MTMPNFHASMLRACVGALTLATCLIALSSPALAEIQYDQEVTNDVIFGSGNANGGFTTDRANGVELGLRAKVRHNALGLPENTFNSNGDGTYTFEAGVAPTQSYPTAVWSFEWSINSDYEDATGSDLSDLTYELAMTSTNAATILPFDPINGINPGLAPPRVQWDHAIGDNTTGPGPGGGRIVIPNAADDAAGYDAAIDANNLAQNSWKPHWFAFPFNPTINGTYTFTLSAFDGIGQVASTAIQVNVVPEPATLALVAASGLLSLLVVRRRSRG
jgi:hypothetical protein